MLLTVKNHKVETMKTKQLKKKRRMTKTRTTTKEKEIILYDVKRTVLRIE